MNDRIERNEELPAGEFVDFGRITDETKATGLPPFMETPTYQTRTEL